MAPPHTTRSTSVSKSHPIVTKAPSKRRRQDPRKPVQRPTRLNKVPLSGPNIATSKALSLQAKDARVGKKRSRPSSKIGKSLSKLGNLADALPLATVQNTEATRIKKTKSVPPTKSLKPKPGMQKKRAALEKNERERFGLNLAILASVEGVENAVEGTAIGKDRVDAQNATKWAALRKHIAGNLIGG